jgi:tetratricopeptide (TPR) repeat protein
MKKYVAAVLVVFLLSLVSQAQISTIPQSASQTGFGGGLSIDGTVLGPSGRPVEVRVRVRLSSIGSSDRITFTNETGNFAFIGLPDGRYVVAVDKEKDFEPVSYTIDLLRNGYRMVVRLRAKPSTELTGVVNAELAAAPEAARGHFERAGDLIKERDRRAAIEALRAAILAHPKFALAYNELGIQYIILREYDNALDALGSALKIKPDYYDAQLNVGVAYLRQKKWAEAEKEIRAAGKMKEPNAVYHYHLGITLANLGKFDEAEPELRTAIKLGGDAMREAHRVLSIIYADRGDNKKCLKELETYVKLTPNAPDIDKLKERIAQLKSN